MAHNSHSIYNPPSITSTSDEKNARKLAIEWEKEKENARADYTNALNEYTALKNAWEKSGKALNTAWDLKGYIERNASEGWAGKNWDDFKKIFNNDSANKAKKLCSSIDTIRTQLEKAMHEKSAEMGSLETLINDIVVGLTDLKGVIDNWIRNGI